MYIYIYIYTFVETKDSPQFQYNHIVTIMIISQVIGSISTDAEMKTTPSKKEYAYFIVKSKNEKEAITFVKCYMYGCSAARLKTLKAGSKVVVMGTQNVSLFDKDNGEKEINININVDKLYFT